MTTEVPKTRWEPLVRRDIQPDFEPNPRQVALQNRFGIEPQDEVWTNDRYQVVVRYMAPTPIPVEFETAGDEWRGECDMCDYWVRGEKENTERLLAEHMLQHRTREGMMHLSIHRHDRRRLRDWRHLQQMKNEVAGPDRWAVEVFPSEDKLVDTTNEYHLWVLPIGVQVPFAFMDGIVTDDEQVAATNEARERGVHKARQHPWEPGLTTGRNEDNRKLDSKLEQDFDHLLDRTSRDEAGDMNGADGLGGDPQ